MATQINDVPINEPSRAGRLFDPIDLWKRPYNNAAVTITIAYDHWAKELSDWANDYMAKMQSAEALAESINLLVASVCRDSAQFKNTWHRWQVPPIIDKIILKAGGSGRTNTLQFSTQQEVCHYLINTEELGLLVTERSQISELQSWTAMRLSMGHQPFDVLFKPSNERYRKLNDSASGRPYSLASIGGTFNALHVGHRAYLKLAFTLADRVHIYVANDKYAEMRKDYSPRKYRNRRKSLKRLLQKWECTTRAEIKSLRSTDEVRAYVETTSGLDLVLCDYEYSQWFAEWCNSRTKAGLPEYDILCKARTTVHSIDVTSGLIASIERSTGETSEQVWLL